MFLEARLSEPGSHVPGQAGEHAACWRHTPGTGAEHTTSCSPVNRHSNVRACALAAVAGTDVLLSPTWLCDRRHVGDSEALGGMRKHHKPFSQAKTISALCSRG